MGFGTEAAVAAEDADPRTLFTLDDADGQSHVYRVKKHPAGKGQDIMWSLIAFGGEPLGAVVKKLAAAAQGEGGLDAKVFANVDWGQAGRDLASSIGRTNMSGLSARLLSFTWRDDEHLLDPKKFDVAYEGNYAEMMMALWEVVKINRFLPL